MNAPMPGRPTWQQLGGGAGVLFFVAILAGFFLPSTPDDETPTEEIVASVAADSRGLSAGVWLTGLAGLLFLVFAVGLVARLRARGSDEDGSRLALLGAAGTSVLLVLSAMVTATLVEAADDGREAAAVRALFELDETLFVGLAFTFAAFFLGAGIAGLSGGLPRWLAWSAVALAGGFVVGSAGLLDLVDDGGPLGAVLFAVFTLALPWILAASIGLLRGGGADRRI
jgi:hypothetical protein